jgi:hypothetical protein
MQILAHESQVFSGHFLGMGRGPFFLLPKIHTDGVMCSLKHLQNVILSLQRNKITLFSEEKKIISSHTLTLDFR